MNKTEHIIRSVDDPSIAKEMDIEPGDVLISINDKEINDVFDYRFMIKSEKLDVLIRKPSGEEWELDIEKDYDDDLGIEFDNDLMSDYKSCSNKCIFCFIDQNPPCMRDTIYFKDDDSRLSFLQGNYITLTNMNEADIDRIITMHLAPINISVQTTNPELRCKMLSNKFAGEKLSLLQKLFDSHIEMNGQIVCVKGVNDGDELRRTIEDLSAYLPFMRSVSVVPAGITKYRKSLYPIELFDSEEAGEVIDLIESYQQGFYDKFGLHFIHASDEWYINAGRSLPDENRYDGYIQLENGVGMMRLFMEEFNAAMEKELTYEKKSSATDKQSQPARAVFSASDRQSQPARAVFSASDRQSQPVQAVHRRLTVVVGKLAYPMIRDAAERIEASFPNISINVVAIRNDFFGETITVTGLITGQDIARQLTQLRDGGTDLGDTLEISGNMLRSGEQVFLDDMTVPELEKELDMHISVVEDNGSDFLRAALGYDCEMTRDNGNFVYVDSYKKIN